MVPGDFVWLSSKKLKMELTGKFMPHLICEGKFTVFLTLKYHVISLRDSHWKVISAETILGGFMKL